MELGIKIMMPKISLQFAPVAARSTSQGELRETKIQRLGEGTGGAAGQRPSNECFRHLQNTISTEDLISSVLDFLDPISAVNLNNSLGIRRRGVGSERISLNTHNFHSMKNMLIFKV